MRGSRARGAKGRLFHLVTTSTKKKRAGRGVGKKLNAIYYADVELFSAICLAFCRIFLVSIFFFLFESRDLRVARILRNIHNIMMQKLCIFIYILCIFINYFSVMFQAPASDPFVSVIRITVWFFQCHSVTPNPLISSPQRAVLPNDWVSGSSTSQYCLPFCSSHCYPTLQMNVALS